MGDLLDELQGNTTDRIGENVRVLGGDLLDEAGIVNKDSSLLSSKLTQKEASGDRMRIIESINADMSSLDKFLVGAGRGLTNVARGVGLAEPEDAITREAFTQLADDNLAAQAGEIIGEAAPFLALAPLTGSGLAVSAGGRALIPAATGAASRIGGAIGLGTLEGGILTKGRGGNADETILGAGAGGAIAGTIEAVLPVLGRLGRKVFQRLGRTPKGPLLTANGQPTAELQKALKDTGTSFDDLSNEAFALVNKEGVDPSQAARAARFKSQGIPATAGDISQDFGQQATEQRILSQAGTTAGEPLRQAKLHQSEAFKTQVNDLVDSLGVPDEAGDTLKAALSGRKKLLKAEKNKLYKEVFDANPDIKAVPIQTNDIADAMPGIDDLDDLSITAPESVEKVRLALARFGIDGSEEGLELLEKKGLTAQPLTAGNFERFRKTINSIERADQTGAAKVMTGPIKSALDKEGDIIADAIEASGIDGGQFIDALKEARGIVRQVKTEFSPQAITGRLIDVKRDGVTPVIEASKAVNELLKPGAPIENLQRTLSSLNKSGANGKKAIKDIQASVVLNALNDALKAPSRKTAGIETIGGIPFAKSLSKFGDDKLELLFKGNKKSLNRLMNLKQTALDITPTAGATPKGSAPVILDIMRRAGSMPGLAAIRDAIEFVVNAGADERAVRKAMDAKPIFKKALRTLSSDFPAIASVIGVSAIPKATEDKGDR